MNSTVNTNSVTPTYSEYLEEIRSWDWAWLSKRFDDYSEQPPYYEDNDNGDRFVYVWIGTVSGLTPSGKIYTFWTTNQTEEDVERDQAWWEALETVAEQNDCFISCPDGASGEDICLCRRYDTPEESGDEEQ